MAIAEVPAVGDFDSTVRTAWFGELQIQFDDRCLEPRPWTEMQSAWAVELLSSCGHGRILELCAGAGQIGLLAALRTGRDIVQVEIDDDAAHFARRNARHYGVTHRVSVRCGDLDSVLGDDERFPVILADPPYLRTSEVDRYPHDPPTAVDGGPDGLAIVRRVLRVAADHLAPRGVVLLQVRDGGQVDELARWLPENSALRVVEERLIAEGGVVRLEREGEHVV